MNKILSCSAALLLLAGCVKGAAPVASAPGTPVTALATLPPPEASDVIRSTRLAFVGPFTELRIEVFGVPEMQRDVMTDGEGNFSFPLIGTVAAAGKTPVALAEQIRSQLVGKYVRDPQVTVNFKAPTSASALAFQSMAVSVDGEVKRSGSYPVAGRMTLMRAVALAGGITEYAKLDDVVVFRNVGTKQYVGIYNLGAIRRGNYADPEIFPNDVVIVGDSPQRRLFKDILATTPALLSPLILLAREF
ncbi:polysaccharide biosynthesis/export family protein [Sphingopyxis terrae]|uniref:Polysaccharide export outer membrane protein n=1 Tax=Sphingopyxis terrae subsp. ummariensis TaxID=429001 RepID=A0A1Y6FPF4_9SPHN|nr:polysaccharide biosynthesis/export family protein [Sphingopyxis terrae]SMQ76597.1 polysaccharide export outer membrane protein [Sphingopyxis terrae subsp. ummariensis]